MFVEPPFPVIGLDIVITCFVNFTNVEDAVIQWFFTRPSGRVNIGVGLEVAQEYLDRYSILRDQSPGTYKLLIQGIKIYTCISNGFCQYLLLYLTMSIQITLNPSKWNILM